MISSLISKLCLAAIRVFPATRAYGIKRALLAAAGVKVGRNVRVVSSVRFVTPFVEIGDDSFIGHETLLIAAHGSKIRIGRNVDIGPRCTIVTGSHEIGPAERRAGRGYAADIVIEDGVWIGASAVLIAGVTVGKGAVVGAGAVAAKSIPENTVCTGAERREKALD